MATRPARNCPVGNAGYTSEDTRQPGAFAPIVLQFEGAGALVRCIAGEREILNAAEALSLVSQRLAVPERTARTLLRRLARAPTGPADDEALTGLGRSALSWRQAEGDAAAKAQAVTVAYHGTLVPPFCLVSARGYFAGLLGAGG